VKAIDFCSANLTSSPYIIIMVRESGQNSSLAVEKDLLYMWVSLIPHMSNCTMFKRLYTGCIISGGYAFSQEEEGVVDQVSCLCVVLMKSLHIQLSIAVQYTALPWSQNHIILCTLGIILHVQCTVLRLMVWGGA